MQQYDKQNLVVWLTATFLASCLLKNSYAMNYCPPDWVENNYACFHFNSNPLNFDDAEAACGTKLPGSHLAAPRDASEYNFAMTLRPSNLANSPVWLGTKLQPDGTTWATMAGSPMWPYSLPWASSHPQNVVGNCGAIDATSWQWISTNCSTPRPSICMFYQHMPSINVEQFVVFNRLHGGLDWSGLRNDAWRFQNGEIFNGTLVDGPSQTPDSALQLTSALGSYVQFVDGTAGVNYSNTDFYFMFYINLPSGAEGPIIQYTFNDTHYGWNLWAFSNGSLLADFVPSSANGPTPNSNFQVLIPQSCLPRNQWTFFTLNYVNATGQLLAWNGAQSSTPCFNQVVGWPVAEMSNGFELGRRLVGNKFLDMKIGCFVSGSFAPLPPFSIGETALWCNQAALEHFHDRSMARRLGVNFVQEPHLVALFPMNNFYQTRDAAGRGFIGGMNSQDFGFGPHGQVNGSLTFKSNYFQVNTDINQKELGAAFTFIRKSFTLSLFVFTKLGGSLFTFAADDRFENFPFTGYIDTNAVNVVIVLTKLGGFETIATKTFANCVKPSEWTFLSVRYDYAAGLLTVLADEVPCGSGPENIGQVDLNAHSNIYLGQSNQPAIQVPSYRGNMACFSVYSKALTNAEIAALKQNCKDVLDGGRTYNDDGTLFKPQHLRLFLPMGRAYGLQDLSGRSMHGVTRGRLTLATGPLGHPFSATRFTNEPNSGIDIQQRMRENPYAISTNDSITYMGYIFAWPNRDGNLPWDNQTIFEHYNPETNQYGNGFFHVTMTRFYYNAHARSRYNKPGVKNFSSGMRWRWFVYRYSKQTRKIEIIIDGVKIADDVIGNHPIDTTSPLTIGYRWGDTLRQTGRMACFMIYDTDLSDVETEKAKDMCHSALVRAYGPAADTTKCRHTTGGWEYNGEISWAGNGKKCMPWTNQTVYQVADWFSDGSVAAAKSYCRNPETSTANRNRPWCYITRTDWEYCNIPLCKDAAKNWPFHKPESLLAFWPMGSLFRGADVSGHDAHVAVGVETGFATGPGSVSNSASNFRNGGNGHYWAQNHQYNNLWDLLDLGRRTNFLNGYSYTIMGQYISSGYTGSGAIWSWEASNGEGGQQGLLIRYTGSGIVQFQLVSYAPSGIWRDCPGHVHNTWYQHTVVYNRIDRKVYIYRDHVICNTWDYAAANWPQFDNGFHTLSGSFKFGRQAGQVGSNVNLACAAIYTVPLLASDIFAIRQKCLDTLAGIYNDILLEPVKPTALWPMSAHTGGMNVRGPNHARFSMIDLTTSPNGIAQTGFTFPGSNMQYFWAAQDYSSSMDVCSRTRSFSMSTYASVQNIGQAMAFLTRGAIYDDTNYLGRGNVLAFLNARTDVNYRVNDGSNSFSPIRTGVVNSNGWVHVVVSYDFAGDNFYMFVNGSLVYNQNNVRYVWCQTSGSLVMGRSAAFPITLSALAGQPLTGALSCPALFDRGMVSGEMVMRSTRYCSHPDFVGCFPTSSAGLSSDFIHNAGNWNASNLTVAQCRQTCGEARFDYAALRAGNICMCGSTYGSDGPETPEKCGMTCTGRSSDWCGGSNYFSVYRTTLPRVTVAPSITSIEYANCLPNWSYFNGFCYRVFASRLDMVSAIASCDNYGATLATIANFDENTFIADIAPASLLAGDYICLGVNSTVAGQSRGLNMDGSATLFQNWASGQPSFNNYWGCMLLSNRLWYAQNPISSLYHACKKPAGSSTDFVSSKRCQPGWQRYGNQCFLFQSTLTSYDAAVESCKARNLQSSLAKVQTPAEYDFVMNLTDMQRPFWLGLRYDSSRSDFIWALDGVALSTSTYQMWAGNEKYELSTRPCVFADSRTQYHWRTADCLNFRYASVCEYSLSTDATSTLGLASGRVLNTQLQAVGAAANSAPSFARLNTDSALCFNASAVPGASLTIDLRDLYEIHQILSRGNPPVGTTVGTDWVTEATVEFSQDGGLTWDFYNFTDSSGNINVTILLNTDATTTASHTFQNPLVASRVRVTPTAYQNVPCLQVELIGKPVRQGFKTVDLAYKPIRYEFGRYSGSFVRYTASVYVKSQRTRHEQIGFSERVTESSYIYLPRFAGWQKLVFTGVDAEGTTHELSHEMTTGTRVSAIRLNMCPIAVLYGNYAACEVRVLGATEFDITTDYGAERYGPRRASSQRIEVGTTVAPTNTVGSDQANFVYLMPNNLVLNNATVYAIEADIVTAGWITLQIYKPFCAAGLTFCPVCHCCLDLATSPSCSMQRPFDAYKCSSGFVKDNRASCSRNGTQQAQQPYFTAANPKIDYQFVVEWRKYFSGTGRQVVYLDEDEVIEITMGSVLAYYRASNNGGRLATWTSNVIKEFSFIDSTPGFSGRNSGNFVISRTTATSASLLHMVKLITQSSVGISFGRKWHNVSEGLHTIAMTVQDRFDPSNVLTYSYDLEVQYKCENFEIVFPEIAEGATKVPFNVPPHQGTKCQYSIDFGDETPLYAFDYTTRNKTIYHVYRLFGSYNVTLKVWNLVFEKSTYSTITIVFPIAKMSTYMANQPVVELNTAWATAVVTFAQASSTTTVFNMDANNSMPNELVRKFDVCPSGWTQGISQLGIDACYRYFFSLSLTYDRAQSFCASYGASLITATTSNEWDFIKNVMTSAGGPTDKGAWTGYNQVRDGFQFWVTEEEKQSPAPPFWQETSGKYPVKGGGSCAYYDYASRRLQNEDCSSARPFVCKREVAVSSYCGPSPAWTYDADRNRCFRVYTALTTFVSAQATCRQVGGQVAVPESSASFAMIRSMAVKANPSLSYYISMWRPEGSSFRLYDGWSSYTPSFSNFTSTPTPGQGETCVIFNPNTGIYKAVGCSEMAGFVCEKQIYGSSARRYMVRTASRRYVPPFKTPPTCPVGWQLNPKTSMCFKLLQETRRSWADAEADCFSRFSAHLATVDTADDHTWFTSNILLDADTWIGLGEVGSADNWMWRDGATFTSGTKPWASGNPDTSVLGYGFYVANTAFWAEGSGDELKAYVCSKPATNGAITWGGQCRNGYQEFAGRCFKFVSAEQIFSSALATCRNEGGGLASIQTNEDWSFLKAMVPMSINEAAIGLNYISASATWNWTADIRGRSHPVVLQSFWAPNYPGTNSGIAVLSRLHNLRAITATDSLARPFICEQPAAVCPPGWTIWAGSCYRAYQIELHVQPGTDYDTARVACQTEDSLPISPVSQEELQFAIGLSGAGKRFAFGYRRLSSSIGFVDLSGRPSYFAGLSAEPGSGTSYAYYTGSGTSYAFTSDMWTDTSVCQSPTKLSSEMCSRRCLAMSDFVCQSFVYDGSTCQFMSHYAPDEWFGLRESYAQSDTYSIRKDICRRDLVPEAKVAYSSVMAEGSDIKANITLESSKPGFIPVDGNDMLTVEFASPIYLASVLLTKREANVDEYIKTFKIRYTFDSSLWFTYQDPPGVDMVFQGLSPDNQVVSVSFEKPLLMKAIEIVPLTWQTLPSLKIRLGGCHGALFTDYAENSYSTSGFYAVTASAYSPRNNVSVDSVTVAIQTRLLSVAFPKIPALAHGEYAEIPFTFGELSRSAWPVANASFNGTALRNASVAVLARTGKMFAGPSDYGSIGYYPVDLSLDNLLSDPVSTSTILWVDYTVRELKVWTNATETHGAFRNTTIAVYVTMLNCSRCNISINYGAADAEPMQWFHSYDFILENTPLIEVPPVLYPNLGGYLISVTANNYLPVVKTFVYDIYIQLEPFPDAFNYTTTSPAKIPYDGEAVVYFNYLYTGLVAEWPSNVSMFLNYFDGSTDTAPFDVTKLPLASVTPRVEGFNMASVKHGFTKYGTFEVYMEVFNKIGKVNGTVTIDVDEDIVGLELVPNRRYIGPGEFVDFNVTWKFGSRFNWQAIFPSVDGKTFKSTPVYNWTVTSFSWMFDEIGAHFPTINATNLIAETAKIPLKDPIVVQYPVTENSFKLTSTPSKGKLQFSGPDDDTGRADTTFTVWRNKQLQDPTEPYFTIFFGDDTQSVNTSLQCDPTLSSTIDGVFEACIKFSYSYFNATQFDVGILVANLASQQMFRTQFNVFVAVTNLRLGVRFTENETNPNWLNGFPRIDPVAGPKAYSQLFFPVGYPVRITANAKLGEGLRYCFFSSVEGPLNDCPGDDHFSATPNSVIKKFNYDTPCVSRLENCGLTLWVVASNPVDTATVQISIYLQKPSINLKLVQNGPAAENTSYPLYIEFDQFPTDACIEMDYGSDMLNAGYHRKALYGSEYTCADSYSQEDMKTLTPFTSSDIASKRLPVPSSYYRKGIYAVDLKIRNFVEALNSTTNRALRSSITVTKGPCQYPRLYITTQMKKSFKKDDLTIPAQLFFNCTSSTRVSLNWTIKYTPNKETTAWSDVTRSYLSLPVRRQEFDGVANSVGVLFDRSITIPGTTLPYGFYQFSMEANMVEEIGLNNSASYEIEVIKSDLVVGVIPAGSRRELVFRQPIAMNAYDLTYDPDIGDRSGSKDGMSVYYFCKRDCDGSWPDLTTMEQVKTLIEKPSLYPTLYPSFAWKKCETDDPALKSEGYESNGCFVSGLHLYRSEDPDRTWGFPSLNPKSFTRKVPKALCGDNATTDCDIKLSEVNDGFSLKIDSSYQFENQTYNLMAIIVKDTRWAIARQSYRLERGEPPNSIIKIANNLAYPHRHLFKYNPTSRASFRGLIDGRIVGRMYFFDWRIIRVPADKNVDDLMEKLDQSLGKYAWADSEWLNGSSTGRSKDDFSLNANIFGKEHYGRFFIVYLGVSRAGNPRSGQSSVAFYVNSPPDVANVSCLSNFASGIAGQTMFKFNCQGFSSPNGVLSKFSFSMQSCSYCEPALLTPTLQAPAVSAGLTLSPGIPEENYMVKIFVDATDAFDSTSRVQFKVRVAPRANFSEAIERANGYMNSVRLMKTEDVCQQMYTFAALLNEIVLDPVYTYNKTAYKLMTKAQKKIEDGKVDADKARFELELKTLRNIRGNVSNWIWTAIATKGLRRDANSVKTCCSATSMALYDADQAAENRTISNALAAAYNLTEMLKSFSSGDKSVDAEVMESATGACIGATGEISEAIEANQGHVQVETLAKKMETSEVDSETNRRKKRETKTSAFGDMENSMKLTEKLTEIKDVLESIVLGGKVIAESSSTVSGKGAASNLQRKLIGDLSYMKIPSGRPDDCGYFRIGDASVMFEALDPLEGKEVEGLMPKAERLKFIDVKLKSSQQSGNPMKFDDSAKDLNSDVSGLVFLNSNGSEVVVKDLPFEIEMMVESKNPMTLEDTQLKTLSNAGAKGMKSMIMNVSSFSALFINVETWQLPDVCNQTAVSQYDMGLNLTCWFNVTTLMFEHSNYTLPSLNITDEEVVFFVYAKFNETPTESNYDLSCTLPLNVFEDEYEWATGKVWDHAPLTSAQNLSQAYNNSGISTTPDSHFYSTTAKPPTTTQHSTTMAPTTTTMAPTTTAAQLAHPPACSELQHWNVTCCNGTVDPDLGYCYGDIYLPTTPAPTVAPVASRVQKNCTIPDKPSRNTCFFDHRVVGVTDESKLLKIGLRAVPRRLVRQVLKEWAESKTTEEITSANALNITGEKMVNISVRAAYRYSAFTTSCKFFDKVAKTWSSDGCRVGSLSTPGGNPSMTQCFCNHLTQFSSGFDVPMNTFDPRDSAFTKLDQNPICFAFGICVICLYLAVLIWARKRDKEDEKKWGTIPLADNDPRDKYAYELTIWTGQRSGAGTTARVSFILRGDEAETPVHMLEDDERDVLQRSGIDCFLLLTPRSLGKLVQLRIWHDNSGKHPNWYFSRMQVHDLQRNRQYYFLCDRWVAIDEDDGMVERIVNVAGKKELAGFEHLFFTKSRRKLTDGHLWVSVFSRPPLSKFTRCQRITCCLSILYCTMLANIMFYGQQRDPPGGTAVAFGPISLSLNKIFISVISALIVMPVNLVIVQCFRMAKHKPTKQEKKMEALREKAQKTEEAERRKALAEGKAASPEDIGITTISEPEVKMSKKAMKKAAKQKKQKKPFKLPWWFTIVGYSLSFATVAVSFWAIVEFGGALGPEKAQEWLVSMLISLVTDILLMQPAKILAMALFFALIIKSPTKDEDIEEKAALKDDEVFIRQTDLSPAELAERKKKMTEKQDYVFLPPDPEELKLAREVRLKERHMWKIIKEIAFYVMFLYLLMMIAFSSQDDWSMLLQRQMRSVYLDGTLATPPYNESIPSEVAAYSPGDDPHEESFHNIAAAENVFTYLERTVIPSVLDGTWYNGVYDSTTDIFTNDQTLFLFGSLRIRQVRTRDDACRIPNQARRIYTQNCLAPYSLLDEDTRNYTAGWQLAPVSNTTKTSSGKKYLTLGDPRGFAYKSEIEDKGVPFTGLLATYNGGGYIVDLGRKVEGALAKLAFLRDNRWIDDKTRAVFIEFNLYCPNRNIWAISQTVVEFFAGGSTVLYPYFYITKIDGYFGMMAMVLLAFQIGTLALVLFLFVREIKLAKKYKRAYWQDPWAVLEFVHLLSCIVMGVMMVMRYAMSRYFVGRTYKRSKNEVYTNFTLFTTYDQIVQAFMGFVLFVAFMRMIRLLRFNRRLVLMISTLKHAKGTMGSFFLVFFVVYCAFAQLGFFAFGQSIYEYSSFISSLESLFNMLLGVWDANAFKWQASWVGPLYFGMFSIIINFFLINIFLALLMFSYEEVRNEARTLGNDHEVMAFMMQKFKAMLGLAPKRATTLAIDKRFAYLDAAMHEDEVDKFTARMDELMTKLDQHLEKTKSQFSGMFDQSFLARKQKEFYITE